MVIPAVLRKELLALLHQGHPGMVATKSKARSQVWWPGIDRQIETTVNECLSCQENRPRSAKVPESPWRYPDAPWERVHIDHMEFEGRLILVVVDAYSKWIDATVTSSTGFYRQATIECLRKSFSDHGVPKVLVSDNGRGFCAEEMALFCGANGIKQVFSPAWHPSSNGQAESAVKVVKAGLRKQSSGSLQTKLCRVLFQYRTTPHSSTGRTPAELLNGRPMVTHLHRLHPDTRDRVVQRQESQTRYNNQGSRARVLCAGDDVFVQDGSFGQRWTAGVITGVSGYMCDVKLCDGREYRRHVDHVRRRFSGVAESPTHSSEMPSPSAYANPDLGNRGATEESCATDVPRVADVPRATDTVAPPETSDVTVEVAVSPSSSTVPQLRRSNRVSRPPERLDL